MTLNYRLFISGTLLLLVLILAPLRSAVAKSIVFDTNLRFGSVSEDVRELQKNFSIRTAFLWL